MMISILKGKDMTVHERAPAQVYKWILIYNQCCKHLDNITILSRNHNFLA